MAFATTTAILASAFVNSLGVNTHIGFNNYGYQNLTLVSNAVKYLGVRNLRDSGTTGSDLTSWQTVAAATGVKFDDYMPEGSIAAMQKALGLVPNFAQAGLLNFVEGGNEEDDAYAIYWGNSLAYTAVFQQQVYMVGHGQNLPVINMSFGQGWTAANNWHGNYDKVGDLSAYTDYGNAHTYPAVANRQPYATVTMLNADAQIPAPGRPVITTELGWDDNYNSQAAVAKAMLNGIMDCVLTKNYKVYLYALFNDGAGKFGLMNTDGTAKPAGAALHNLTTLLADTGPATFKPSALSYQLSSLTNSSLLLQKTDGAYWLAVWDETAGAAAVTLSLASAAQTVQVYDPLNGTNVIQAASNTSSVTLNVDDHPLLVRIVPGTTATTGGTGTTPPPAPAPNVITSYANNTTINANTGTTAVYSYGTGNTINGSSGTYTIQAYSGSNTFNGGSGTATIYVGGFNNKVTVSTGTTTVYSSGSNSTFAFGKVGGGLTTFYGYVLDNGNVLDFRALLADTEWNGSSTTIGNFLKVSVSGATTSISVVPSGQVSGVIYPVAVLHGYGYSTLTSLLAHSLI